MRNLSWFQVRYGSGVAQHHAFVQQVPLSNIFSTVFLEDTFAAAFKDVDQIMTKAQSRDSSGSKQRTDLNSAHSKTPINNSFVIICKNHLKSYPRGDEPISVGTDAKFEDLLIS